LAKAYIDPVEIGNRIRTIREKYGKTQSFFADMTYISPSYLSLIETGQRLPSVVVLSHIANFADVSIDYLVYGDSDSFSTEQKEFSRLCAEYSSDEMIRAMRLAEYSLKLSKLKDPTGNIE